MLRYLNGKITQYAIPNETCLLIKISKIDEGTLLSNVFTDILKEYSKHITTICFLGGEEDQIELAELARTAKKAGLKTCLSTYLTEESQINLNLLNELDYLQLKTKTYRKEYSPFGDADVWIDV